MNPFDIVKNINAKDGLLDEPDNMFIVNRAFSRFRDTILFANELNQCKHLDKHQQYRFLYHAVPKGKRFASWDKPEPKSDDVELIMRLYNYSRRKAEQVMSLFDAATLRELGETGGKAR